MKGVYRLAQSRRKSLAIQRLNLGINTEGSCKSRSSNLIRWEYVTRPSALGREYKILIVYKFGLQPNVFVIEPDLFQLTDGDIPHLFRGKKDKIYRSATCLCLYRSKYGEWHAEKLIAETIVPWVDLWLLYFEYWLITGTWEGGGEHPE